MSRGFSARELTFDPAILKGDCVWLHAYWAERAGDAGMPYWHDIQLIDFPNSVLPILVIMDVVPDDRLFVFRYFGTERVRLQHIEMTGKSVRQLEIPGLADAMVEQNSRTVEARAPVLYRNSFRAPNGLVVEYDALRLPVTDDGENVGKVLALSHFISDRDQILKDPHSGPTPV